MKQDYSYNVWEEAFYVLWRWERDWSSRLILEVLHLTPETQLTARLELLLYSLYPLSLLEVNLHVPVAGRYFQCPFAAFLPALPDIAHSGRGSYINESDLLPHQYGFIRFAWA